MRTELPAERLRRRLIPDTDDDEPDPDTGPDTGSDSSDISDSDPNSLLPRWLPDGSAGDGWLARVRADPGRAGAVALAVVAALAVLVTVFTVIRDRPAPVVSAKLPPVEMVSATSSSGPPPEPAAGRPVVVSVVGLVHRPGLATLTPGARIADALDAAGGVLDGADTTGLNMARRLADGEQIVVGITPPRGQPAALGSSVTGGSGDSAGPGAVAGSAGSGGGSGPAKPASTEPVNLNTATVQQLDALPGVGPVTAAAIVAWRETHGKFGTVDQLGEVDGIGPARLEKLRALVCV